MPILPRFALTLALLALPLGCQKNRTEIVLGMATDLNASTPLSSVELQVYSLPDGVLIADQQLPISGTLNEVYELPGTYAVYSASGSADRFRALLTATDNNSNTLVVRSAVMSLVPGKTLFARLGMVSACEGTNDCGTGQTCIEGRCASEDIDSSRLPEYTAGMENQVDCTSPTTFVDTSTKKPLEVIGTACAAGGTCLEGVCLAPAPSDAGADGAAASYTSTKEIGSTHLSGPQNIFIEPATQNVLVADFATGGVVELDSAGNYLKTFGTSGNGQLSEASGITEDPSGNIYIGDYGASTIVKFDNAGNYLTTFPSVIGTVTLVEPAAVAADAAGNIWIANDGASQVVELDGLGNLVGQFSTLEAAQGGLAGTVGLALDGSGNIWVAQYYYHVVAEYSPTGSLLKQYGSYGTGQTPGVFSEPYAVAIDPTGRIFVADIANNDVQILDAAGNFKGILTTTSAGALSGPSGVAIDKNGLVYVSDSANVIHVFTPVP